MTSFASNQSNGLVVWFTGLSSSGKTTLATELGRRLIDRGLAVEVLDADTLRRLLSPDLGFSKQERDENVRRIGFVASLLARHGVMVIVAAISPYRAMRDHVRRNCGAFLEVYVNAPLEVCEGRDQKGLYSKARSGEILNFTGISDPYEAPLTPEVECRTDQETVDQCVNKVMLAIDITRDRLA